MHLNRNLSIQLFCILLVTFNAFLSSFVLGSIRTAGTGLIGKEEKVTRGHFCRGHEEPWNRCLEHAQVTTLCASCPPTLQRLSKLHVTPWKATSPVWHFCYLPGLIDFASQEQRPREHRGAFWPQEACATLLCAVQTRKQDSALGSLMPAHETCQRHRQQPLVGSLSFSKTVPGHDRDSRVCLGSNHVTKKAEICRG